MDILSKDMHSPNENKIYFTKNWQIENEHFVILVLEKFMKWKNWRGPMSCELMNFRGEHWSNIKTQSMSSRPRYRNFKMRSIVWMMQEILRMPNQCAVDKYLTSPSELAMFPLPTDPGGPLRSDQNPQPDICNTHSISGNVFANSRAYSSTPYSRMHSSWDFPAAGKNSGASEHGETRSWKWWSRQRHTTYTEISTKFARRKFIQPYGGEKI